MGLLDGLPKSVSIYEVGPRDGLQNEAATVPTHAKVRLIEALLAAGLRRIENSEMAGFGLVSICNLYGRHAFGLEFHAEQRYC